jgi:hypothetical protein
MNERYIKLAGDLKFAKEASIRVRMAALLKRLRSGAKPVAEEAKAVASSAAKKSKEVAGKAKSTADPKLKELWAYIKKNKKGLAATGAAGAAAGASLS